MQDQLFGVETEYAVSGVFASGQPIAPGDLAAALVRQATALLPHLRSQSGTGLFLQNGGRLYVDCGWHPEIATPECLDPWDAVRFVRAGDRIMERLRAAVEREYPGAAVMIFRANVDYTGALSTWGCHESYLYRSSLSDVAEDLVPHLVSRPIYAGSGGFNPASSGLEFTLSPRAAFIGFEQSGDSVLRRGIIHTRDESLSGGNQKRLHVIFGESLCSDLALWLKTGTTALVLAMADAGVQPGSEVRLASPLAALRAFAADPRGRARATLANGKTARALDIQRHYLRQAERHRGARFMPAWADAVCERWREVLALLEAGPASVSATLDWAVKHALYVDHARRRGFSWQTLPLWTRTLAAGQETGLLDGPGEAGARARLRLDPQRLRDFTRLRQELFEIDMRFGEVGARGIFGALDRAGRLAHAVEGVGDREIDCGMSRPPDRGRARLRGEAITRLAGRVDQYGCDWTGIWSSVSGRWLDLSDPFQEHARWSPMPQEV